MSPHPTTHPSQGKADEDASADTKGKKPLYDVPHYFDSREFLRYIMPNSLSHLCHAEISRFQ